MANIADNSTIWNEAGKWGLYVGGLSVLCLSLKEFSSLSGSSFLITAASVVLWSVEFFGCIYLMQSAMRSFKRRYDGVKIEDMNRLGRRIALFSGLLLASAQAVFIMQMPEGTMDSLFTQIGESMNFTSQQMEQVEAMSGKLPVYTFIFQWLYCFLYGAVLSSILSKSIFLQDIMKGNNDDNDSPDEQ